VICGRLYDAGVLAAELIREPADLDPWLGQWDRLSVELGLPYCGPAWMLGWWQHVAVGTRELRVVVVHEGDELVGICPTFAQLGRLGLAEYRMLGAGSSHRIGPFSKPGREADVAEAIARTLADARPRPSSVVLEAADGSSAWPDLLRKAWPGPLRPRRYLGHVMATPTIHLDGDFDTWFKGRSGKFRQTMRGQRRKLEEKGARLGAARTEEEAKRAIEALFRLHRLRWEQKQGHSDLTPGMETHIREVADNLGPGRIRLYGIEAEGEWVAVHLQVAAGGEASAWNSGFDPAWMDVQPGQLLLLAGVEGASEAGDRRVDLGGGDQPYKLRFATHDDPLVWIFLFPRNRRYLLTRAQLLPKESRLLARKLVRQLPDPVRHSLRRLLRRQGVG
jgi:CelD/BcsL family acetyltransferase involved in cellulose biosynthesis